MPTIYQQVQKQRYRITLDIEALGDFDPHNINWERLFELSKVLSVVMSCGGSQVHLTLGDYIGFKVTHL